MLSLAAKGCATQFRPAQRPANHGCTSACLQSIRQACQRQQQRGWQPAAPAAADAGRRWQRHRHLAPCAAAEDEEMEISGAFCMPAFVTADNSRSKCFTVLDVEVADYPGLLRVISWTLNGLDVVAQNAVVRTSKEGQAHNTFWLTSRSGKKLSDLQAELLAERVRDFVTFCSPDESAAQKTDFCMGPIFISNSQHEQYTVVAVQEPSPTPGFLLEVASALSAQNVQVLQGVVQGVSCDDGSEEPALEEQQQLDDGTCLLDSGAPYQGRTFRFWVTDSRTGAKLDYGAISALTYTLANVLGYRSHPTSPPEQEMLLSAR